MIKKVVLMLKRIISVVFLLIISNSLFAVTSVDEVPDSSKIRANLIQSWFEQDLDILRHRQPKVFVNEIEDRFQVRLEEYEDEFAIVVAPAKRIIIDVIKDDKYEQLESDSFPMKNLGSWVLYRSKSTGEPIRIKWFFHSDKDVYIQFRPNGSKTYVDFIMYNSLMAMDVPLGFNFEKTYGLSFADMYRITQNTLPWKYTYVNSGMYDAIQQMVYVIRENLHRIEYCEDAAINELGQSVLISTEEVRENSTLQEEGNQSILQLSSAGFAKWIIDGLASPIAGGPIRIAPLKVSTVDFLSGSLNEGINSKYNIYFSLDWTRHLASASLSVFSGKSVAYSPAIVDVSVYPFAYIIEDNKIQRAPEYIKNAGYSTKVLKSLFCSLAATEPDYFYLGAIRESNKMTPEVLYFNEVAAFFPWFDENGHFNVTVFESGVETSLESFMNERYNNNYVHIVRVKASEYFKVQ